MWQVTQVSATAAVVHEGSAHRGACAGDAEQHRALWAVVRTEANGDRDLTVHCGGEVGHRATGLVALGAQVARAAVDTYCLKASCVERYRGGCLQGPVGVGVGHVGRVAGPAVLAGRAGIALCDFIRLLVPRPPWR